MREERHQREEVKESLIRHKEDLRRALGDLRELKDFSKYQEKAYDKLREYNTHWETNYTSLVDRVENHGIFQELKKDGACHTHVMTVTHP